MSTEFLNPPELCPTYGWSHVVTTSGGRTIHVSGQVGIDSRGELVGRGDLQRQTEQAFENVRLALAAAGATMQHVVKSTIFVVNFQSEMLPAIREVRGRYFSQERPPASTLVGVTALAGREWLIEIEATAVVEE
ncbi:MAG: RidA family protein [Pirellulaceae bacterium]|jgi:enamine deaminase RidA (YjgF/YER057c/UK114 family)|nr:RidA family protein [Pirellulaceae bacterium]